MIRGSLVAGAAVVACATIAACGGPSPAPPMSKHAVVELDARTRDVRAATVSGNRLVAEQALAALRTAVKQLRRSGQLSSDKASAVLDAVADVESELGLMPTTTTTTLPRKQPKEHPKGKHGDG